MPNAGNRNTKRVIDWESIEKAYRGGIQSIRQIARTYGITHRALIQRAQRDGWVRDLASAVRQKAKELVATSVSNASNQIPRVDQDDVVNQQAAVAAEIIKGQRTDIAQMRKMAKGIVDDIDAVNERLNADPEMTDEMRLKLIRIRGDLYRDLAQAMAKVIPLERQAYSLDESNSAADDLSAAILKLKAE
jgi:hypothetical protein